MSIWGRATRWLLRAAIRWFFRGIRDGFGWFDRIMLKQALMRGFKMIRANTEGSIMKFLQGKKMYLTGAMWMLYGAYVALVEGDVAGGVQQMLIGIGIMTGKSAIKKLELGK